LAVAGAFLGLAGAALVLLAAAVLAGGLLTGTSSPVDYAWSGIGVWGPCVEQGTRLAHPAEAGPWLTPGG
jgi:hypothetical protein